MRWTILIVAVALWLIVDGGLNHWRYTNTFIHQVNAFVNALTGRSR